MACTKKTNPVSLRKLDRETEASLIHRWQQFGDQRAALRLIEATAPTVRALAKRFCFGGGERFDDLVSCGNVGTMDALNGFNPSLGNRFNTYARWTILKEMVNYVIGQDVDGLKLSAGERVVFSNLARAKAECGVSSGGIPDDRIQDITDAINRDKAVRATPEQVRRVNSLLCQRGVLLDHPVSAAENPVPQPLADPTDSPDAVASRQQTARKLSEYAAMLPERQQAVLRGRFRDGRSVPYAKLGRELGVSATRIQQIERQALGSLRKICEKEKFYPLP